jgi:hypothetical protein
MVKMIVLATVIVTTAAIHALGYSITKYDESPGLYYDIKGVAVMYNTIWKTIVFVDLTKVENETLVVRQYVNHVEMSD